MKRYYVSNDKFELKPNKDYQVPYKLDELFEFLCGVWDIDTCASRLRDKWSKSNPTVGQCTITSFIIQDIFGGDVYGILLDDGNYHSFNYIDGVIIDMTKEQFDSRVLEYSLDNIQSRDVHFKNQEKYDRYKLLKRRIISEMTK